MKIQTLSRFLLGAALVLASACGAESVDLPRTPAATTLALDSNGFSFANFSAARTTEEFDASDLVAMFGATPEVCSGGTEPCSPTAEAAAFARMVNQARASGHCEGLVALAASRFIEKVSPATGELQKEGEVVHAILRAFATQFLPESQKQTNEWAKRSLEAILKAIQDDLGRDTPGYTLNLYTDSGGHAVLPIAIEFPSDDTAIVRVYDSNWPGQNRFVTFDLAKKSWTFSFSGRDPVNDPDMWTGGEGDVDLTSLASRTSSSCPFCGDGASVRNTLLVIRSVDKKIEVTTDDGTVTPDSTSAGETTMKPLAGPGAAPGNGEPRDYIVSVPAGNTSTKVKAGTEARVVAITRDAITEAKTPAGGSRAPIEITPSAISVTDPAVELTLAAGGFVVTSTGENNSVSTDGNAVTATVDDAAGVPTTVETTPEQPAAEIVGAGADALPPGASHVVTTQSGESTLVVTTYSTDGSSQTTETDGTLENTGVSPELTDPLAATDEVPGLPPEAERLASDTSTSSTVPVTTTTQPTDDGATDGGESGQTTQTTRPRQTTTTTPKQVTRTAVTINVNLDEWGFGANDVASAGFDAALTMSGTDTQRCSTAVCLESMVTEGTASGTDPTTGRNVTTAASFTMSNVAVQFSVRCGNTGTWVTATGGAGSWSAACSIASVTQDETVYIRT